MKSNSLFYSELVGLYCRYCDQVWIAHLIKDSDKLEQIKGRAKKMVRSLDTKLYEQTLKELEII